MLLAIVVFGPAPTRAGNASRPIRLYVFAGQSNMVGASAITAELPAVAPELVRAQPNVLIFGPDDDRATRWSHLTPVTERKQPFYGPGFGPELSAAPELAKLHERAHVAIVKFARNGTSLNTDWDPDVRGGLYDGLMSRLRTAFRAARELSSDVKVTGFFWMQGEWDADTPTHAQTYGANLERFIGRLRRDIGSPRLPVVIGRIRDVRRVSLWRPFSDIVRAQQERVAIADPYSYLVSTDGLSIDPRSPVHFDTRGTVELGRLFARRFATR